MMEQFLRECLANLEPLTGIRQLYFLEQDQDGERKIGVLIKGMLVVCGQFDYIPQKDQQKIISDMMVKDQNYDAMNSRTLYKWFELHKDVYWTKANGKDKDEPIVFEPLSDETKKLIAEFQAGLLEKTEPKFPGLNLTMDQIRYEDSMRLEGEDIKPKGTPDTRPVFIVDVKDEEGNVIQTVENVKASTPEKAQEIATEYVRKKLKI